MEIEALLKENKDLLNSFDQNKDGKIDHTELRLAVQKSKIWAERVIKEKSTKEWFYYGQNGSVGPNTWHEITEFYNNYADVFITNEHTLSGEKNKVQWLPAKLILQTIQILQNS